MIKHRRLVKVVFGYKDTREIVGFASAILLSLNYSILILLL